MSNKPAPAGNDAPEKSNPSTLPELALNDVSPNPLEAPVRVTPFTLN